MEKKSTKIIENIISAKTKEEGLQIVNEILEALNLSASYKHMVELKTEIEGFQKKFKQVSNKYTGDVQTMDELNLIRKELSFLYRDCVDMLSSEVNMMRIFFEESKTTRRAKAMEELKESNKFNVKSASGLRDILGESPDYQQFVAEKSLSYANYKTLENLLNSIRMTIDAISAKQRSEMIVMQHDVK